MIDISVALVFFSCGPMSGPTAVCGPVTVMALTQQVPDTRKAQALKHWAKVQNLARLRQLPGNQMESKFGITRGNQD